MNWCVKKRSRKLFLRRRRVCLERIHINLSAHQQRFNLNCKYSPQSKYFGVGRRTPITPTALCWLAVRCWYVCKPQHGRLLGVALYGCSCLDCTSWHFSVSMSSFPLPFTHTHRARLTHHACKHDHACCLHPSSVLLLIGVCLVIFLYLLIFSHPRKRILFFPPLHFWRESEWMTANRQADPGLRWQLCYDFSARSWLMVCPLSLFPHFLSFFLSIAHISTYCRATAIWVTASKL